MSKTLTILQDVLTHLQSELANYEVRLFPDNPTNYRFIHPHGAVLIGYHGSQFEKSISTDLVVQERAINLYFTVFGRGLNGDGEALDLLDLLRASVIGFKPVHCSLPIYLISEKFLDEDAGAWQYELRVQTQTMEMENRKNNDSTKFVHAPSRTSEQPLNPNLKPKSKE